METQQEQTSTPTRTISLCPSNDDERRELIAAYREAEAEKTRRLDAWNKTTLGTVAERAASREYRAAKESRDDLARWVANDLIHHFAKQLGVEPL